MFSNKLCQFYGVTACKYPMDSWTKQICLKQSQKKQQLVGGFNPFEKYESKWESSPNRLRGENKKYLSCHQLDNMDL